MKFKSKNLLTGVLLALIVLTLAFIWGNSFLDREQSTELSTGLLEVLEPVLSSLGLEPKDDHFLRKLAHFCEFTLLGIELSLLAYIRSGLSLKYSLYLALASLAVAVTDENIQRFSGRSCQLSDMLLDLSGAVFGICLVWVLLIFLRRQAAKE